MIRWIIFPTRDRQQPYVQHRPELGSDCDFCAAAPNQKWADDISYIWTRKGWLYLALDHGPRTDGGHGLAPGFALPARHWLGREPTA